METIREQAIEGLIEYVSYIEPLGPRPEFREQLILKMIEFMEFLLDNLDDSAAIERKKEELRKWLVSQAD